jgi:serine/threonine-protein kinase
MAPEQMRSAKDVDTRADIWSLGAMLYEMLTGQPPYLGESIPQLCAALLHDDPVPLRQHRPEIPEGLEQAVLRCLQKDRNHRFQTVFELGRALLPYSHPNSRIHVERAERVLGVTDATMLGIAPSTERAAFDQSSPAISVPVTPLQITPLQVMPQPAPLPEPTVNSWGQSGAGAPPKRRGKALLVGGIAALLAAAGGLWAARSPTVDTPQPKTSAPTLSGGPVPTPPVEVALPTAVSAEPAPTLLAPPPSSSAGVAETPPTPAATDLPVRPKAIGTPLVPKAPPKKGDTKRADSAPGTPTKTGGITDFGGRR